MVGVDGMPKKKVPRAARYFAVFPSVDIPLHFFGVRPQGFFLFRFVRQF
jgi:hypothetical protein